VIFFLVRSKQHNTMLWSKSKKQNDGTSHPATEAHVKPGPLDRAVGYMKQAAGRVFDEPDLYHKGLNQVKYGSRVTVNDAPIAAHRPWASKGHGHTTVPSASSPYGSPVSVDDTHHNHSALPPPPVAHLSTREQPHVIVTAAPSLEQTPLPMPGQHSGSGVGSGITSPFDQPAAPVAVPAAATIPDGPADRQPTTKYRWF